MYTLWSTGMIRREVALDAGGLPDYGSPFLGDFAYLASTGSRQGCLVINRALGCQTVHDFNFGRKECGEIKQAAIGFVDYIQQQLGHRPDWARLRPKVEQFVGQWVVLHGLFLRQYFRHGRIKDHDLRQVLQAAFQVPFLRKFRKYYWLGVAAVALQNAHVQLRNRVLNRMRMARR